MTTSPSSSPRKNGIHARYSFMPPYRRMIALAAQPISIGNHTHVSARKACARTPRPPTARRTVGIGCNDLLGGIRWPTYARDHHRFKYCRFPVGCQRQELEVSARGSELFLTREADKMYLKRDIW